MRINITAAFAESVKPPSQGQADYWDTHLPAFGLRVSKSGRKTWTVIYRVRGHQRRMAIGTFPILGVSDARAQAKKVLHEVQLGKDPAQLRRDEIEQTKQEREERSTKSFDALA